MEPNDARVDDVLSTLADTMCNPPSASSTSSASSSPTFTSLTQSNILNLDGVRIKIVEQPALKGLRFRYICEGRSAGSIPGVHSTPENKTFPTIEIEGYEGKVKVVVSCVTKDEPYRPHPHNLVGKEGCEHGVSLATINGPPMRAVFSNLGIQCVKKKDIKAALEERERKRIDPFKTSFTHKDQPSSIDLNVVRLCFQAFIPIPGIKKPFPIPPVVSDPIYDKKSINDLVICRLCSCAAKVTGGDKIILLCEKVPKDDIKVRFFELRNNELYWEDFGEFQQTDVHKQAAIAFKTPRYINPDVNHKVQVYIQLYRPSDGETSEALQFEFFPDPGMRSFAKVQGKLKRIQDTNIFQQIFSLDSEITAIKYSVTSIGENANGNDDSVTSGSSTSNSINFDTINEHDDSRNRRKESFGVVNSNGDENDDTGIYDYIARKKDGLEIELSVPQITFPCTEFQKGTREDTIPITDDNRINTDLIGQSVDIDDFANGVENSKYIDENFDETATIAIKNPIEILSGNSILKGEEQYNFGIENPHENVETDLAVFTNPPAPKIKVSAAQIRQTRSSPPLPLPSRTALPNDGQILPPLPPKRKSSQELSAAVTSHYSSCNAAYTSQNGTIYSGPPSQIIIMRTPDQSPTKRSANVTLSHKKKQGFFSRIFSRKKSKPSATTSANETNLKPTTPSRSHEPSIENFSMNDHRFSTRSVRSLQPDSLGLEPKFNVKAENILCRSFSSNSGKRPTHLNADVIHIPLKVDSSQKFGNTQNISSSSCCTIRYDGGLLDRKTLSALQLADIPISDGNMELIAIADRQSIKNLCDGAYGVVLDPDVDLSEAEHFALYTSLPSQFDNAHDYNVFSNQAVLTSEEVAIRLAAANYNIKRKRIKTGGNPINLLREIQQLEQNQVQCYISNSSNIDSSSMWNILPSMQTPSPNTSMMPEVKAEPFLSPNYYSGSYRNTYLTSPQPTSPMMNRNNSTPSPGGLMSNSSSESPSHMSNLYNQSQIYQEQHQHLTNNLNLSTSVTCNQAQGAGVNNEYNNNIINTTNRFFESNANDNFNMISSQQQQTQFTTANIFVNRTSGGSFTPIYANEAANSNINTSNARLQSMNIPSNLQQVQAVLGTTNNMVFNQIHDSNPTVDSSLFHLSQLNDLVPLQNSDELRISNLSIST